MQTEEINTKTLDEASTLIHSSDIEMTVKEELEDHPVEASEKPSTATTVLLDECNVAESSHIHLVLQHEQDQADCTEALRTKHFSGSQDNEALHSGSQRSEDTRECPATFPQQVVSVTGATGTQQKNERGRGRGRRRSRWKLKFHHQALPPEYLDHYEATMAQQEAAAAAKSTAAKTENRGKSVPTIAPRTSPSDKVSGKQVVSPTQCFIKIEPDHSQFDSAASPLMVNTNAMDHLHILPMQALSIGTDTEILNRLQRDVNMGSKDDISIISEKPTMHNGKVNQNNNKGLLGSLLANTTGLSEMGNKHINEIERKRRSSVIMSSTSGGNMNSVTSSRSSTPATPIGSSGNGNCSKVINYQDLPYMGEMTLDNMKPRRGRKPKKADICHLIYKNYGTIFPGAPNKSSQGETEDWPRRKLPESSQNISSLTSVSSSNTKVKPENLAASNLKCKPFELLKSSGQINHSDVQNRIISSLLEKRLTAASQDAKKNIFSNMDFLPPTHFDGNDNSNIVNSGREAWNVNNKRTLISTSVCDEPLNLCVKDLNQLKIRLLRKHGNFYEPRTNDVVSVKSEPPSPSDIEELELHNAQVDNVPKFMQESGTLENRTQTPMSLHRQEGQTASESFPFPATDCSTTPVLPLDAGTPTGPPLPGGYIYWPSAGVFVHPMALQSQLLYYQKMGAIPLVPISPAEQCQAFLPSSLPQVNLTPHPTTPTSQTNTPKNTHGKEQKSSFNKTQIPKAFSMMMDASAKPSVMPSEITFPRMKRLAPLGNPPTVGAPTKRKRSAIFIPPMPSENSTNPTTEVSICKFKFTGGAKPSLQEKKMLSVDSGGNFRYYSGTGDKSMRGYEFFPRESLQQPSGSSVGSSSEQFLAASALGSGEKIMANSNLAFVPEDHRTGHLKQLSGLTETITKGGLECSQSRTETGGRVTDSNTQLYEHQNPGVSNTKKKSDLQLKGRPVGGSSDGDRFGPAVADDQNPHSQFRLRRKRKTRKSLAREKLEQTFKEKGFLIQTQQLESAEGATYCKFRQLRKFTRYLFRSWKDYLPGNVREMSVAAGVAGSDASPPSEGGPVDSEIEGELSSSNSPTPSIPQQATDSSPPQLSNT